MKLYIAGPMSGIPYFNIPAFSDAARRLRGLGYEIVCPSELDSEEMQRAALASKTGSWDDLGNKESWGEVLARDVKVIADGIDGIVFLPDWHRSRGARLEAFVALLTGKTYYYEYRDDDHPHPIPAAKVRQMIQGNMP